MLTVRLAHNLILRGVYSQYEGGCRENDETEGQPAKKIELEEFSSAVNGIDTKHMQSSEPQVKTLNCFAFFVFYITNRSWVVTLGCI